MGRRYGREDDTASRGDGAADVYQVLYGDDLALALLLREGDEGIQVAKLLGSLPCFLGVHLDTLDGIVRPTK
jgi:hypothetical protein